MHACCCDFLKITQTKAESKDNISFHLISLANPELLL